MRKIALTALAAAAITVGAVPVHGAVPSDRIAPSRAGYAAPLVSIRLAAAVCGGNGCYVVQTKQKPRRKFQVLGHG